MNSPPPKPEVILTNFFAEPTVLLVPITSRDCGTYCYNSCNTFSRSESGAETRSQTFQFLLDILNQNQVVEQVSTDI